MMKGVKMNWRQHIEDMNYYNDRRVRAMEAEPLFTDVNEKSMTANFTYENDDGEEVVKQVHLRFEVCDLCEGRGKVVNPSVDCGGLTSADFDADPDLAEEYTSGTYDIDCPQCKGKRVVPVLDISATSADLVKCIQDKQKADADFAREVAAERMMGA